MTHPQRRAWLACLLVVMLLATGCAGTPAPATDLGPGATDPPAAQPTAAAQAPTEQPPAAQPPPAADGPEPEPFDKFDPDSAWHVIPMTERGNDGKRYVMTCPPGQAPPMRGGFGTDVYADASPVCYAAVHVGVISAADGGDVVFEMRPGQDSYTGSERNGVTTLDYGEWEGSFVIISGVP